MKFLLLVALCVVPALSSRLPYIVGGKNAQVGAYPWQASLQSGSSHICGASLISSNWLVTASHCVGGSASQYSVVLGLYDRTTKTQGDPQKYDIAQATRHPSYSPSSTYANDIAMLRTSKSVSMNQYVATITLPQKGESFYGTSCVISGWGRYSQSSNALPNYLQEAAVAIMSDSECRSYVSGMHGSHVCIYGTSRDSACNGDSGGPLACQKSGRWYLVGAASFVYGNCITYMPNVYSSTAYNRDWIKSMSGV